MNLLIDFVTLRLKTGAGEYGRYFIMELVRLKKAHQLDDINIYALYDSRTPITYTDMQEENLATLCPIQYVDIAKSSICDIVLDYKIDRFFIICAQYLGIYPEIENLQCEIVCVFHDLFEQECYYNFINEYVYNINHGHTLNASIKNAGRLSFYKYPQGIVKKCAILLRITKRILTDSLHDEYKQSLYRLEPIINLLKKNSKVQVIAVSDYTKASLIYNYGLSEESISVYYSPHRIYEKEDGVISNKTLKEVIASGKKYFLMVSANRELKNPKKVVHAFKQYARSHPESYLLVIGYPNATECENIINLDFLTDNDLALAYQNCHALIYPSFFEGFGYPPVEAMYYGKPILCTNTTSLPEILGTAPIYFSPFYETGIFNALLTFESRDYEELSTKSKSQYKKIAKRQKNDAALLINTVTGKYRE